MNDIKYELIIIISNHGFVDEMMETARKVGARGGTIIHGRGTASEEIVKFFGLTIQPEKEILLIVTKINTKKDIMLELTKDYGNNDDINMVCFSVPVTDVCGFHF